MSIGRRAYDLLRGHLNYEWDRIHKVDDESAINELAEGVGPSDVKPTQRPERELTTLDLTPDQKIDLARRILGVQSTANFEEIRGVYDRISKRADPSNFPIGSPESEQAGQIQRRVQWAYSLLTESMDGTEKRFKSLEIE